MLGSPLGGWNLRKLTNGLDPVIKAQTFILAISLSKLKTNMSRKREIHSKDKFEGQENHKTIYVCLKIYVSLEVKRKKSLKQNKKKKESN